MTAPRQVEIGAPLRRIEDHRLLTGRGCFLADVDRPGQAHAVFVRSPHAHARIAGCETAAARAAAGVVAVYTGADVATDGLPGVPVAVLPPTLRGIPPDELDWSPPPYPAIAGERVRYVGEAVALVIAETLEQARDAAELVDASYDSLPAVTESTAAITPAAPRIWDDQAGNVCFHYRTGDDAAVDAAFARATNVVRLALVNNRIVASPMETRGAIAEYDTGRGRYTIHAGTQKPHLLRDDLAANVLGVDRNRVRFVSADVGGGFGARNGLYPEYIAVLWAARRCARPVKWIAERTEAFLADVHGRDNVTEAALALDGDGRFLAMRTSTLINLGAYIAPRAMVPTTNGLPMLTGPYRIEAASAEVRGVFTNTAPTQVYRGAGRPEGAYVLERLVDAAARELALDPIEIRRRNLIGAAEMPWTTPMGSTYDGGDFARTLDKALALADLADFGARREDAARKRRRRGVGIALFVEHLHAKGHKDTAGIALDRNGKATLHVGSCSNGQGHETVFPQIVAARLGLPVNAVRLVQGDTDLIAAGHGTGASRSMTLAGGAVDAAAVGLIEKGRLIAAGLMEAAATNVAFERGQFTVAGTDRSLTLLQVAATAESREGVAPEFAGPFAHSATFTAPADTFPNGCHVCEVEVDPDTGEIEIVKYAAVHDFGRVVNPMLVAGQMHGALAQGLGQALLERIAYDPETGQLISASFADYGLPHADDLPAFAFAAYQASSGDNPLGVKGCGESGCSGAPPALVNAVLDALAMLGVTDLTMPLTPESIWSAIAGANRQETTTGAG